MTFDLTPRDRERLQGVHPDLVRVIELTAATGTRPFAVIEGCRSRDRQAKLLARGASKTMNSRHIPAANGLGHAVDIAPLDDGEISWAWPDYYPLAKEVKATAAACWIPLEWGGDWKSFKDGPHWQLPWKQYPGTQAPIPQVPQPDIEPAPPPVPPTARPGEAPPDWPAEYEIEQPKTIPKSKSLWAQLLDLLGKAGIGVGVLFGWLQDNPEIVIAVVVVGILITLFLGRERIKKIIERGV